MIWTLHVKEYLISLELESNYILNELESNNLNKIIKKSKDISELLKRYPNNAELGKNIRILLNENHIS